MSSSLSRRSTLLIVMLMLCLSVQFVQLPFAQAQPDAVTQFATSLDQQASARSLPLGDGAISPAEQTLAAAVVDEISSFSDSVASFEQASPQNAAFLDAAEQAPSATGDNSPMVQAYLDTVARYEAEIQSGHAGDVQAEIIADSVAEYSDAAQSTDPKVQAVSDAVNAYMAEDAAAQAADPKVQAVSDAIKDYLAESDMASDASAGELQDPMVQAVSDAVTDYLNSTDSPRKDLVKKHIDRITKNAVPKSRVDLMSGIYTYGPNEYSRSGDCSDYRGGDADGPGSDGYNPDDPTFQVHVCFAYPYGLATVDNEIFRAFGSTMPNLYQTDVTTFPDSTMHKQMSVLDPNTFEITTIIEAGTCTITSTTRYTMYVPGAPFGCNPNSKVWTIDGDKVDVKTGEEIDEITEPDDVIIDPIIAGEYSVAWMPFDPQTCHEDYAPTFDTVTLTPTAFDEVELTALGQTFRFGGSGMEEGMSGRFDMLTDDFAGSLDRRLPTDFDLYWQATSPDNRQACGARGLLSLLTADAEQPVIHPPFAETDDTPVFDPNSIEVPTEFFAVESGDYAVAWEEIPGLECPAELLPQIPDFSQATLEASDTELIVTAPDAEYTLRSAPGGYSFTEFGDDGSGLMISIAGFAEGQSSGSYTLFAPDGEMCLMIFTMDKQ